VNLDKLEALRDSVKAFLMNRQRAYITTFNGPVGEKVLADLAKFCRAHETTFHENDRVQANLEGRKEVWLRIAQHLNMNSEDLWKLYGIKDLQ